MALSNEQVEAYLDRINIPHAIRDLLRQGPNGPDALKAVAKLQCHHLKSVPFENLDLGYSAQHALPQDTESVFERVIQQGRGGVCDQVHPLFVLLLRHFGFSAYCAGSRINAAAAITADPNRDRSKAVQPNFGPWVHLNTIVKINGQDYVVDTSHGPSGFPTPVPLVHDVPAHDVFPRQRRMIYTPIPGWHSTSQKWWRMQIRWADTEPWLDVWAFTETEWLPFDLQLLRLGYSQLGTGWVLPKLCCFRTEFEDEIPTGYTLLLEDDLSRMYQGKLEVLQKLYSEADRLEVLQREFGITLTEEEQQNIAGHVTELKDEDFDYYG